jgi:hypothetical protein
MSDEEMKGVEVDKVLQHVADELIIKLKSAQELAEKHSPKDGSTPTPLFMAALIEAAESAGGLKALKQVFETGLKMAEGEVGVEPDHVADEDIPEDVKGTVASLLDKIRGNNGKLH